MNIAKVVKRLLAVCAAVMVFAPISMAVTKESTYTMMVVENFAYGKSILSGRYELAINRLAKRGSRYADNFETQTNLCVAYTKSGQLSKAEDACNAAVDLIQRHRAFENSGRSVSEDEFADAHRDFAIALSNRGVLLAAMGQADDAARDFREAEGLGSGLDAPSINLARAAR